MTLMEHVKRHRDRQTGRQEGRQTYTQTDKQTDGQTDRRRSEPILFSGSLLRDRETETEKADTHGPRQQKERKTSAALPYAGVEAHIF